MGEVITSRAFYIKKEKKNF